MSDNKQGTGIDRRGALECMIWAGTGVIWTLTGGVPKSSQLLGMGAAQAAEKAATGFSFLQISDSHIGFNKPANPDALGTLKEAIDKVNGLPVKPAFMIHTGDITHLSKPGQFDDAEKIIGEAKLDVHYVPGEHDLIDEENGKAYLERYGKNTKGTGWYSFDAGGVHFIGLVNVANLKAGGMGSLGDEQLAWLAHDLKGKPASTPIVVFAHIPLWAAQGRPQPQDRRNARVMWWPSRATTRLGLRPRGLPRQSGKAGTRRGRISRPPPRPRWRCGQVSTAKECPAY